MALPSLSPAPIKRMLRGCVRLSQSVNSSGFPADQPIGRFRLSKITFDLIIPYPLPVQITALCWDGPQNIHGNGTVRECASGKQGDREERGPTEVTAASPCPSHCIFNFHAVTAQLTHVSH